MLLALLLDIYASFRVRISGERGPIIPFPFGLILKIGYDKGAGAEGETMRFIRKHTSIPVPRVYVATRGFGYTYTLMDRIEGENLQEVWMDLTTEQRSRIVAQLRQHISELRILKPSPSLPPGAVCSLHYKPLMISRIASAIPQGPFPNEAAFNERLLETAEQWMDPDYIPDIRARMRNDHRIVFTHADFAPRNIMVQGDTVAAIIDWEESGWYPEYWELVKAIWSPGEVDKEWVRALRDIISRDYEEENSLDCEMSRHMVGAF